MVEVSNVGMGMGPGMWSSIGPKCQLSTQYKIKTEMGTFVKLIS